jgi:hypothetical protein
MTSDEAHSPEVLISVANEVAASAIVAALEEHGVKAMAVGGFTAGFRAEAPGDVRIVVRRNDLTRAQQVLEAIQSKDLE